MASSLPSTDGIDTYYSAAVSSNAHLSQDKMIRLFGFATKQQLMSFVSTGDVFYILRALFTRLPSWPAISTRGFTIISVLSKVDACARQSKCYDKVSPETATLALLPADCEAASWSVEEWLAWAVHNLDVRLRLPGNRFGQKDHPHDPFQSRQRLYRLIMFLKQKGVTLPSLQAGRVADDDSATVAASVLSAPPDYGGKSSLEEFKADVAMKALMSTCNRDHPQDLGTSYGRFLVLKSVEAKLVNPAAGNVLGRDMSQDILEHLAQVDPTGSLEAHEEALEAMSGESRALLAHQQQWDRSESENILPPVSASSVDNAMAYERLLVAENIDSEIWGPCSFRDAVSQRGYLSSDLAWDSPGPIPQNYRWKHSRDNERVVPHSWQIEAIVAGRNRHQHMNVAGTPSYGIVVADDTGIGKTMTAICIISSIATRMEACEIPKKPFLVLVPGDLIMATIEEFRRVDARFKNIIWYQGSRKTAHGWPEAEVSFRAEPLTKSDLVGIDQPHFTIVVSSLSTWRTRHGPAAMSRWQSENGPEPESNEYDANWPCGLDGVFGAQWTDEAHYAKNHASQGNQALVFLKRTFFILTTATPMSNAILDVLGYVLPLETAAAKAAFEANPDVDPFLVSAPGAPQDRIISFQVLMAHVFGRGLVDHVLAGRIKRVLRFIMVRRTYLSQEPLYDANDPPRIIGAHIPALVSQRLSLEYSEAHQRIFEARYDVHRPNMVQPDPTSPSNVKPNLSTWRKLILLSTALWFDDIGESLLADQWTYWRARANPLYDLVKQIYNKRSHFPDAHILHVVLPAENDVVGQLVVLAKESPKLRSILAILLQKVVVLNEKVAIVCHGPGMQIVLFAVLKALRIPSSVYSSDLKADARAEAVRLFGESAMDNMVWVSTYNFGSVGLNLQKYCNFCISVDTPINMGQLKQFLGRLRRLGQMNKVRHLDLFMNFTFQTWVNNLFEKKYVSVMLCELDSQLQEQHANDSSGRPTLSSSFADPDAWVLHSGVVRSGRHLAANELAESRSLSPQQLVAQLMMLRVEDIRMERSRR